MKACSSGSTWIRLVSGGRPVYLSLSMGKLPGPCGNFSKGKVKGKVRPVTGHEGPEVE